MARVFVSLPVPAADGAGAWVDTSGIAPSKTLTIDGGDYSGRLTIESSNDAQVSAAPVDVPVGLGVGTPAPMDFVSTLQFMRVRRTNTATPGGAPTVKLGGEGSTTNIFGAMAVPAGDGVGAAIDLSGGGAVNTFNIVGPFFGAVYIEISTDAGATWSAALLVGVAGQQTNGSAVGANVLGALARARVRRAGVVGGTPSPVVSVGSGSDTGSGGGGTVTDVTSADHSIIVTTPLPTIRDLKWNATYQLVDSYGVVNDAPALVLAATALAARPHNNGVLQVDGGGHRLQSEAAMPPGIYLKGGGKNATNFIVDGNAFDALTATNPWGNGFSDFRMTAIAPRASGAMIRVKGGNPAIQPFFGAGGYTLSANETEIDRVDLDDFFDGVVIENNGAVANWLMYVRNGRYGGMNGGDAVRVDAGAPGAPTQYGASYFFQRIFAIGKSAAPVGNGLRIRGAGDFTIEKYQTAVCDIGLLIDPVATARLSTGRFSLCQFNTANQFCAHIVPAPLATFMDLAFDTCWFAGGGIHNVLANGESVNTLRFMNSFFFFAIQYGLVFTGPATGAKNVQIIGNQFSGAGVGGVRAVAAGDFDISHNQFMPSIVPPIAGMPQAVTIDAGCHDFVVRNNQWRLATAGLLDNSGNVAKSVGGNLGANTVSLNLIATLSGIAGSVEGALALYLGNDGDLGGGSTNPFNYPTSERLFRRLWLSAPGGTGTVPVTATLIKNNVATAMTCTIAAGQPAGTVAVDVAHPIAFAAADRFDVFLSTGAAAAEGSKLYSVVLEGPEPGP